MPPQPYSSDDHHGHLRSPRLLDPKHILQHGTLLAKVWGREYVDEVDYIRVYIGRLREKLADNPDYPRYIRTERGLGYRFAADEPGSGRWELPNRSAKLDPRPLGCGQAVRRLTLDQEIEGSNPSAPANLTPSPQEAR